MEGEGLFSPWDGGTSVSSLRIKRSHRLHDSFLSLRRKSYREALKIKLKQITRSRMFLPLAAFYNLPFMRPTDMVSPTLWILYANLVLNMFPVEH